MLPWSWSKHNKVRKGRLLLFYNILYRDRDNYIAILSNAKSEVRCELITNSYSVYTLLLNETLWGAASLHLPTVQKTIEIHIKQGNYLTLCLSVRPLFTPGPMDRSVPNLAVIPFSTHDVLLAGEIWDIILR